MNNKQLYGIINEQIGKFDYLGMDDISEEEFSMGLLDSKEFQTSLVNDIIINKSNPEKFKNINSVYQKNNADELYDDGDSLKIEYEIEITYIYDGQDIDLLLILEGNMINYDADVSHYQGSRMQPPDHSFDLKSIDWSDVEIAIISKGGDELDFKWLNQKPSLYNKVIFSLIGDQFDVFE